MRAEKKTIQFKYNVSYLSQNITYTSYDVVLLNWVYEINNSHLTMFSKIRWTGNNHINS